MGGLVEAIDPPPPHVGFASGTGSVCVLVVGGRNKGSLRGVRQFPGCSGMSEGSAG